MRWVADERDMVAMIAIQIANDDGHVGDSECTQSLPFNLGSNMLLS